MIAKATDTRDSESYKESLHPAGHQSFSLCPDEPKSMPYQIVHARKASRTCILVKFWVVCDARSSYAWYIQIYIGKGDSTVTIS